MDSEKTNDTDLETKEQDKLYRAKRSYLKCKRKLDVDQMTYDEIMNFPVRKNHPKYDTEEERIAAKKKNQSLYNKNYHATARGKQYYNDYYYAHFRSIVECPHCNCKIMKGSYKKHLATKMHCKVRQADADEIIRIIEN
jgi:hypothetical protein